MIRRLNLEMPEIYRNYYTPNLNPPDLSKWTTIRGWLLWHKFSSRKKVEYCIKHPLWFIKSLSGTILNKVGWRFTNSLVKVRKKTYVGIINFLPNKSKMSVCPQAYYNG